VVLLPLVMQMTLSDKVGACQERIRVTGVCGRIVVARPLEVLADFFGVTSVVAPDRLRSWNVAPGTDVLVVAGTAGAERRMGTMRWGFVPSWSTEASAGPRPINARVESLLDRPMFADALSRRRCLVVVDGFYEWRRLPGGSKQPYFLDVGAVDEPFALAGLWDRNAGEVSCAVITGPADEDLAWLHDRMPVRLDRDRWDDWLDPANRDVPGLFGMLQDSASVAVPLRAQPVAALVNSVRNDGPELVAPLSGEIQPQLL